MYNNQKITLFTIPNIIQPALKKSLQTFRDFLETRKKIKEAKREALLQDQENEKLLAAMTIENNDYTDTNDTFTETKTSNTVEKIIASPKTTETSLRDLKLDISSISVGSWINYQSDKVQIKCKLAAKITSKDSYIFVDRKGIKVLELTTPELVEKLDKGKINLISTENNNSQLLESVIAKTRVLKAEI